MEKQTITEEMKVHEQWYREAHDMTLEKLPEFLRHLAEDYQHDYGTICHAISAGAVATAWAMDNSPCGGITGFQASCIMWGFIQHWSFKNNKCGLRLLNMDDLLYPQYEYKFQTISKKTFEIVQKEAEKLLAEKAETAHPKVAAHWLSIAAGNVPFGLRLEES